MVHFPFPKSSRHGSLIPIQGRQTLLHPLRYVWVLIGSIGNTLVHAHTPHAYACMHISSHTHARARTHAPPHTRTRTHTVTHTRTSNPYYPEPSAPTGLRTISIGTRPHTNFVTHIRIHSRTHAPTHAHTHTNARTHMLDQPVYDCSQPHVHCGDMSKRRKLQFE